MTRGYLPRSILIPLSSNDRSEHLSSTPPTPIRHDLPVSSRAPRPLPRANQIQSAVTTEPRLINSSHHVKEEERIYLNQLDYQRSIAHPYASVDPDESTPFEQVSILHDSLLLIFSFI